MKRSFRSYPYRIVLAIGLFTLFMAGCRAMGLQNDLDVTPSSGQIPTSETLFILMGETIPLELPTGFNEDTSWVVMEGAGFIDSATGVFLATDIGDSTVQAVSQKGDVHRFHIMTYDIEIELIDADKPVQYYGQTWLAKATPNPITLPLEMVDFHWSIQGSRGFIDGTPGETLGEYMVPFEYFGDIVISGTVGEGGSRSVEHTFEISPIQYTYVIPEDIPQDGATIALPLVEGDVYNLKVLWDNDMQEPDLVTTAEDGVHTFTASGEYQVSIWADTLEDMTFTGMSTKDTPASRWMHGEGIDTQYLVAISQFGSMRLVDNINTFANTSREDFAITAHDAPYVEGNISGMFSYSTMNANLTDWDVSRVTGMKDMFFGAVHFNNGELPGESTAPLLWDTAEVVNTARMFSGSQGMPPFNQDLSSWDLSSLTNASGMFALTTAFNQDMSEWVSWEKKDGVSYSNIFWGSGVDVLIQSGASAEEILPPGFKDVYGN